MLDNKAKQVTPFLKWAGGKRWLINSHPDIFPDEYNKYVEPFVGGGATFFHLAPKQAVLGDLNNDLILTYKALKDDWETIYRKLNEHHQLHSQDYYYDIRNNYMPEDAASTAARFIYLNRTCWNGLYRVNSHGKFNVPIGTNKNVILKTDSFQSVSDLLQNAELHAQGFQETINLAQKGDFVFVDPPYTIKHNYNGFVQYNETLFSWNDQELLSESVKAAIKRGAKVLITNAKHESIMNLYRGMGEFITLDRHNLLSGKKEHRGRYEELIIKCF